MNSFELAWLAAGGVLALVIAARLVPGWMEHRARVRKLRDRFANAPLHRVPATTPHEAD
ncbi:hypothetical protein ACFQY5_13145 [Paeniroseomonas aquatica]|uniref:Cellulose biosynthesis protein BcsF n=1 Tax=Paeniroseomonas aquatica TaxID=373043 RepID=A0ABT8ADD7_9PROT|nr:hypothetical protein [Paeniroseomonas aquatica]MDN3567553.1 hypothetical protein [Paeniroseomonas aquatica]